MTIEPIEPFFDPKSGLDFGEFFDDPGVVRAALWEFSACLNGSVCYCWRFQEVKGGMSWFEPYGLSAGLNGLITDAAIRLPKKIWYDRLVKPGHSPDGDDWPPLARWNLTGGSHPSQLANPLWCGQARLQDGNGKFVGYFKAAFPHGSTLPSDISDRARDALARTRGWLERALPSRRASRDLLKPDFQAALKSIHEAITRELSRGAVRGALRLVSALTTSHLVTGFNRIVWFVPHGKDLIPYYGHGGDCSDDFSARIQLPLTERVHTIPSLNQYVDTATPPDDDPLYSSVVGCSELRLNPSSSASLLAELWKKGALDQLAPSQLLKAEISSESIVPQLRVRIEPSRPVAAHLTTDDPLFAELKRKSPTCAILCNRNGQYYLFPWSWQGQLIGLAVADLGYWGQTKMDDVMPRILTTEALLDEFAVDFANAKWDPNC